MGWFPWPKGPQNFVLAQSESVNLIEVQAEAGEPTKIIIPKEGPISGPRFEALLKFCIGAGSLLAQKTSIKKFNVQLNDECPADYCFRFDAPLQNDKGGPLIPDPYCLMNGAYIQFRKFIERNPLPRWEGRIGIAFWRGSSTGITELCLENLKNNKRYKLCLMAQKMTGLIDAKITNIVQSKNLNSYQDIKEILTKESLLSSKVDPWNQALHKWIIEIDGNVNSWGFLWKLISGSCILKVESKRKQWFYKRLIPWTHFVPIKSNLSDLEEKLIWCRTHQNESRIIASQGKNIAKDIINEIGLDLLLATKQYKQI